MTIKTTGNDIKTSLITQYMEENNLTKTQFCEQCQIGHESYDKIMKGQYNYRIKTLAKVARTLNVRLCEMFE